MVSILTSFDVDHVPKSTRLSLHFFPGVKGHAYNYCTEEGESGNEATISLGGFIYILTIHA